MAIAINHEIVFPTSYGTLNNEHGFIGNIENELQLYDALIQIANEKAEGYYIEWKGQRLDIDSRGELVNWPIGYADHITRALVDLFRARGYGNDIPSSTIDWRHND